MAICAGCSKQPDNKDQQTTNTYQDPVSTLAKQYGCPILNDEVAKVAGSNSLFSIHIQRALKSSSRFASDASLCDLVQEKDRVEAIFEIEHEDKMECVAKLECPTNLIPSFNSQASEWAIVFEPTENHYTVNISQLVDGDDTTVVSGLIVEGKLIALEKDY